MTTIYAIQNKTNNNFVPVNGTMFFSKRSDARAARANLQGNDYRIVTTTVTDWKTAK
jgi:hypothetical protein